MFAKSFTARVALPIGGMLLVSILILSVTVAIIVKDHLETDGHNQAAVQTELLAEQISDAVLAGDSKAIEAVMKPVMNAPVDVSLDHAVVLDADGNVIADFGAPGSGSPDVSGIVANGLPTETIFIDESGDHFSAATPVRAAGTQEEYGVLVTAWNTARLSQAMLVLDATMGVLGLTAVALSVAALIWILHAWAAVPIRRVQSAMLQIADGDLDADLPTVKGEDEIAQMAGALAVLREKLQDAREQEKARWAAEERANKEKQAAQQAAQRRLEEEAEAEAELLEKKAEQEALEREREALRRKEEVARAEEKRREAERMAALEADRLAEEEKRSAALNKVVSLLSTHLARLAEGDLACQIDDRFSSEYEALRSDFNRAVDHLGQAIGVVTRGTVAISEGSQVIRGSSNDLAKRSETVATTLVECTDAARSVKSEVETSNANAKKTHALAEETRARAERGASVARNAIEAMERIEGSSGQIATIISVIEDIAFQTNLLALNAGVEAARAGDAGRGFAVVASEVQALALRASHSANEIKGLIEQSSEHVGGGVDLVRGTGEAFGEIVAGINEIGELLAGISASSGHQIESIRGLTSSIEKIDGETQSNAAIAEELTATAETFSAQATEIATSSEHFKLDARTSGQFQKLVA